jgi:uncharacterized membrane protein YciS (DUF1049 family)
LREIVILLLVVALAVMVIGAVNQDQQVDLDYVFGTWEDVSVLSLSAVCTGAAVVLGLVVAAMARLRVVSDRRKLERELSLVYPRLREAERAAGLPAWNPQATASDTPTAAYETMPPPPVAAASATPTAGEPAGPPPPVAAAAGDVREPAAETQVADDTTADRAAETAGAGASEPAPDGAGASSGAG